MQQSPILDSKKAATILFPEPLYKKRGPKK